VNTRSLLTDLRLPAGTPVNAFPAILPTESNCYRGNWLRWIKGAWSGS